MNGFIAFVQTDIRIFTCTQTDQMNETYFQVFFCHYFYASKVILFGMKWLPNLAVVHLQSVFVKTKEEKNHFRPK